MASAQNVSDEIQNLYSYIKNSVSRFMGEQTISAENYRKLNSFSAGAESVFQKSRKIWDRILLPYQAELARRQKEVEDEFEPRLRSLRSERQRYLPPSRDPRDQDVMTDLSVESRQHESAFAEIQQERNLRIQDVAKELAAEYLDVDSPELSALLTEIEGVQNQLVETEKSIRGEEVTKKALQGIASHKAGFEGAMKYHKRMSQGVLFALAVVLIAGCVFLLFFITKPALTLDPSSSPQTAMFIVSVATALSGKLAFLLVWAWIMKYLGNLHSIHSEQAVIYSDRSVSLNIAESLLLSAPQPEQRTALLNTLAKGYLDIEKNAFRGDNISARDTDAASQLGLIKELLSALKPLLDSLQLKGK